MGRKNGDDVSALEAELKEKFAKLNEVGREVNSLKTQHIPNLAAYCHVCFWWRAWLKLQVQ